jgi:hypothetical protein
MTNLASPQGEDELAVAVSRLVDLANDSAREGVSHSGVVKEALVLTTGDTEVHHGLARTPRFVIEVLRAVDGRVYVATAHADPRNFVYLRASAAGTYNVLIA